MAIQRNCWRSTDRARRNRMTSAVAAPTTPTMIAIEPPTTRVETNGLADVKPSALTSAGGIASSPAADARYPPANSPRTQRQRREGSRPSGTSSSRQPSSSKA